NMPEKPVPAYFHSISSNSSSTNASLFSSINVSISAFLSSKDSSVTFSASSPYSLKNSCSTSSRSSAYSLKLGNCSSLYLLASMMSVFTRTLVVVIVELIPWLLIRILSLDVLLYSLKTSFKFSLDHLIQSLIRRFFSLSSAFSSSTVLAASRYSPPLASVISTSSCTSSSLISNPMILRTVSIFSSCGRSSTAATGSPSHVSLPSLTI